MYRNPAALTAALRGDFVNAEIADTPGGIERQEKLGQEALVASSNMPLDLEPSREAFEALGITFGRPIDKLFQEATLPAGWTRRGTEHAMWSHILDDKGRIRIDVFYKAAFYDLKAHASLNCRYRLGEQRDEAGRETVAATVQDGDVVLHHVLYPPRPEQPGPAYWDACKDARQAARVWLDEARPGWTDPLAYWEEA